MEIVMTVQEMIDQLGLQTEDEGNTRNPEIYKLRALNNSVLKLCNMLRNEYLVEDLQQIEKNVTLTASELLLSGLSYSVFRSGAGILNVKITGGKWCTKQELDDQKVTDHPSLAGNLRNPLYTVFGNKIIVSAGNATAIDVYYLKMPSPLLYTFVLATADPASKSKFVGPASKGLSAVNDAYDGAVVYITQQPFYAVIKNYVGATREFEIFRTDATLNLTTGSFYFTTGPFKLTGIDNHYAELSASLSPLVITLAESELWLRDKKKERADAAFNTVKDEVAILNARYEPSPGVGRRKPEGGGA